VEGQGYTLALVRDPCCMQSQHTEKGYELTVGLASKCITMVQLCNHAPAAQQETLECWRILYISYSGQMENEGCPNKISERRDKIQWMGASGRLRSPRVSKVHMSTLSHPRSSKWLPLRNVTWCMNERFWWP
jgi:hypothetical protein